MILGNILRRNSKLYPNNESLIYEEYRFTWAETQKRINSLVNGLLSLGIQKGDRIAVLSDNPIDILRFTWHQLMQGL